MECIYEAPVKETKGTVTVRAEIEALRIQRHHHERILAILISTDWLEDVLERLHSCQALENITEGLDKYAIPAALRPQVVDKPSLLRQVRAGRSIYSVFCLVFCFIFAAPVDSSQC